MKINWENIQSAYNDQYALSAQTKNNEVYDYASILQYHLTVKKLSWALVYIHVQNKDFPLTMSCFIMGNIIMLGVEMMCLSKKKKQQQTRCILVEQLVKQWTSC